LTAARIITGTIAGTAAAPLVLTIKDESGNASGSKTLTFTPASGNIDGVASKIVVNSAYGSAQVYCNGTNWFTNLVGASTVSKVVEYANANDQLLTSSPTSVISFTPVVSGNYIITNYFRVITAPTVVTIVLTWTDGTGAQTLNLISSVLEPVGSYTLAPTFINATTGGAITVTYTTLTNNQVFASAAAILL
jgi:hypothetical protein